jgi:uncharacterized membrane protein (UPF0182 family)
VWGVVLALVVLVIATPGLVNLLVTYWWFGALGYGRVYATELAAAWALGLAGAVVAFLVLKSMAVFVTRIARAQGRARVYRGWVPLAVNGAMVVLALLCGLGLAGNWQPALFALRQVPFGVRDPIFHHDVAFYVFTVPLLQDLLGWLGLVLFLGLVVALVLLYALDLGGRINSALEPYVRAGQVMGGPEFDLRWLRPYLTVVSFWLALLALLVAGSNWLMRYASLVSPGNGFQGGSYVDLHAGIPGWTILAVLGTLAALVLLANAFVLRRWLLIVAVIAAWLVAWIVLVGLYPAVVQGLKVNPAPLAAEAPQIAHNITATRAAFNLTGATSTDFPATDILRQQVAADRAGIDSLRVEDPDQFGDAAQQQQAIRTYYDFPTVGLDRYRVGGNLRQVLIAGRELNQSQLPSTAQNWQNLNFTYTHGYGLVMAPVNTVAADGSPLYWIKDVPPHANADAPQATDLPAVTHPQIYFGLDSNNAIFVDTGAHEFDYSTGYQEQYASYKGTAGIPIGGFLHRLAWVIYFNSPIQIGTSSYLTATSRVLLHRNIADRLATLAPFFTYDSDPYLVLDGAGHLTWIVDGYTTSADYPYAQPYGGDSVASLAGISYIRNAVKATIDTYNGTVRFYVADPSDPIVHTIGQAFPGLLQPFSAMPADLRVHVRYPEDLFSVQSDVFARYHQTEAQTWYNNEDQWAIPTSTGQASVAPYYAVTRLPGNAGDEFVLMRPYNPLNKTNMVALLVGRSDPPHYGQLVVYRFPLGRQILGPQQLQANIQQKPEFSRDITLWNQQGSHVHYGNIIIVPVGTGLLYLEPLYLQAENSRIPQLQRVITYANGKLVWGSTLGNALGQIFGKAAPPPGATAPPPVTTPLTPTAGISGTVPLTGTAHTVLLQIQAHLNAAQAAYGRGDFATYAKEQAAAYRLIKAALGQSR